MLHLASARGSRSGEPTRCTIRRTNALQFVHPLEFRQPEVKRRPLLAPAVVACAHLFCTAGVTAQQAPANTVAKETGKAMLIQQARLLRGKPGGPRPTDFTSAPGSGHTLQYWRLISKDPGK